METGGGDGAQQGSKFCPITYDSNHFIMFHTILTIISHFQYSSLQQFQQLLPSQISPNLLDQVFPSHLQNGQGNREEDLHQDNLGQQDQTQGRSLPLQTSSPWQHPNKDPHQVRLCK